MCTSVSYCCTDSLADLTDSGFVSAGALLVATGKKSKWLGPDMCSSSQNNADTLGAEPCRQLRLTDVTFENNFGFNAGGAVFASIPDHVWISKEVSTACHAVTVFSNCLLPLKQLYF